MKVPDELLDPIRDSEALEEVTLRRGGWVRMVRLPRWVNVWMVETTQMKDAARAEAEAERRRRYLYWTSGWFWGVAIVFSTHGHVALALLTAAVSAGLNWSRELSGWWREKRGR